MIHIGFVYNTGFKFKDMKIIFMITFTGFCLLSLFTVAQVKIGENSAPDASAILEIKSTNTGFLPPRITLTAKNVAAPVTSPVEGLMVYNTATAGAYPTNVVPGLYYWTGTIWQTLHPRPQLVYSAPTSFTDITVPCASATVYYSVPGFSYTAPEAGVYHLESSLLIRSYLPATTGNNIGLLFIINRNGTAVAEKLKNQLNFLPNYSFGQRTLVGEQTIPLLAGDVLTAVFAAYSPGSTTVTLGTTMFIIESEGGGSRNLFNVSRLY